MNRPDPSVTPVDHATVVRDAKAFSEFDADPAAYGWRRTSCGDQLDLQFCACLSVDLKSVAIGQGVVAMIPKEMAPNSGPRR